MLMAKLELRFRIFAAWALLSLLYVVLASSIAPTELIAAAACAGMSIAIARPLYQKLPDTRQAGLSLRIDARLARMVWRDTLVIARDSLRALWRASGDGTGRGGVFRERRIAAGARPDIVALALSLAPNSYVVDIREQEERIVFHHLIELRDDDPSREAWPP
jgi:hypothetical protein